MPTATPPLTGTNDPTRYGPQSYCEMPTQAIETKPHRVRSSAGAGSPPVGERARSGQRGALLAEGVHDRDGSVDRAAVLLRLPAREEPLADQLELLRCCCNFVRPHGGLKFGLELRTPAMQAGFVGRKLTFRDVCTAVAGFISFCRGADRSKMAVSGACSALGNGIFSVTDGSTR